MPAQGQTSEHSSRRQESVHESRRLNKEEWGANGLKGKKSLFSVRSSMLQWITLQVTKIVREEGGVDLARIRGISWGELNQTTMTFSKN